MKKKLLLLFVVTISSCLQAQVLLTENSSALTVGNIGSDLTGTTPGQGGWLTYVATGGANSDFQVVNQGGVYGNALQVTGSNTAANTRYLYKGLSTQWGNRTAGNNIAEVEFNFFTGPATTSLNTQRVVLFDPTGAKVLGGLYIAMNTRAISGYAYYNNAGTLNNYIFNLGAGNTVLTLLPNTWYKFGFSFNKTTGQVIWRESTGLFNAAVIGASVGIDVLEVDIFATAGTGNTVASVGVYDNISVEATATDALLGTQDISLAENKFSVFPNPASNLISISNSENILVNEITITDLNGRIVKQSKYDNTSEIQINVSDLASGMYLMNITSDQGSATKKIVKN